MKKQHEANFCPDRPYLWGFTIIELLIVIGIIVALLSILLPSLAKVRARSHETVCAANLRQLGQAVLMYANDFDDRFPYGGDPADIYGGDLTIIPGGGTVHDLQPIQGVLSPYVSNKKIWACPADTGFTETGFGEDYDFNTIPSSFERFGASYYYYTELAIGQYPVSNLSALDDDSPQQERGPADIIVLSDGTGLWHGGYLLYAQRYNSLFVDGHVKSLSVADYQAAYDITLVQ